MRRRRPAPAGDTTPSVVPLSRAHRVRPEVEDAGTAGATALERRAATRSRFGELTNTLTPPSGTGRQKPNAPRAPARARRANGSTELHDGWTFVLIPPGADARPRTLRVSVRRLRFAVASLFVLIGSTVATSGLLMLALNVMPPAQDEVRGIELGVFASVPAETEPEIRLDSGSTPASIAAASAGAAAPRATARPRPVRPVRRAASGSGAAPSAMESLPVVGEITSRFARARRHPLLGVVRRHAGIDIAAPAGTHILAPAAGRVRFSGKKFGYGYTVEIDHGGGVITRYAHCRSLMVRQGDDVAAGAIIATVGRSGLATAPHLHYEVMVNGRNVNPLQTQIATLLAGRQPSATSSPPPADSALRAPAASDATAAPDVPDLPDEPDLPASSNRPARPRSNGDTIATARIPTVHAPHVTVTESLPGLRPIPQVVVVDTAKKS